MSDLTVSRWCEILDILSKRLPESSFKSWLEGTEIVSFTDGEIVVGAPSSFVKSWLEKNYENTIREVAAEVYGFEATVRFTVVPNFSPVRAVSASPALKELDGSIDLAPHAKHNKIQAVANGFETAAFTARRFTFSNFIGGESNRMACAAAKHVAENPGAYSPLVISGDHGLGKSHLLYAIGAEMSGRFAGLKITSVSCEDFLNDFVAASQTGRLEAFRNRYRNCDVLLVDDLQSLAEGKRRATQAEFAQTFDVLYRSGKQMVFTLDRELSELGTLDSKLLSRLSAGLTVRLDRPDEVARIDIIHAKAYEFGVKLPAGVVQSVAAREVESIREIEGAVRRLAALGNLAGAELSQVTADQAFGRPFGVAPVRVSPENIIAAVAKEFALSQSEIIGKKRLRKISVARSIAIHLCRRLTSVSLVEIGEGFGGRKHSTILSVLKSNPLSLVDIETVDRILRRLGVTVSAEKVFKRQASLF